MEKNELEGYLSRFTSLWNITEELTTDMSYDLLQFRHYMYPFSDSCMLILYNTSASQAFFLELQRITVGNAHVPGVVLLVHKQLICVLHTEDKLVDVKSQVQNFFGLTHAPR